MFVRTALSVARPAILRGAVAARPFSTVRAAGSQLPLSLALGVTAFGTTAYVISGPVQAASPSVDFEKVKADILKTIEVEEERRSDGTSIAPTFVRLAWHCCGTYSKADGSGGSNGCRMRFNPEAGWGANAGLATARMMLDPIKKAHPGLSYADLYVFAGKVAIEAMDGPVIPFSPGRVDFDHGDTSPPDGRLPDADKGSMPATSQHLRDIFYRMGFNDQEIVALSGAHALGRCHEDASGFWGPWTNAETTFSNEYFRLLVEEKWTPKKTHVNSSGKKCPWKGNGQYEDKTGSLMMLPSDIALTKDEAFAKFVKIYAKDEEAFRKDFATACGKLFALGTATASASGPGGIMGLFGQLKGMIGL